jgi:iron complex transport system permease protein
MSSNRKFKLFLLLLPFGLAILSLLTGAGTLDFKELKLALLSPSKASDSVLFVVWDYRIPKLLTALLAGAGLALSGLLMQTLFRNPMAGPFVLGISSGASFGVSLVVLGATVLPAFWGAFLQNEIGMSLAALTGSFLVLGMIVWASAKIGGNFTILLLGLIVGQILSALQGALSFLANPEAVKQFMLWGLGSFEQTGYTGIVGMAFVVLLVLFVSYTLAPKLNAFLLGDLYVQALGVDLFRFRKSIVFLAGLSAGVITAFCGPIAFLGMAVPHLVRHAFKTYDHSLLLPFVAIVGASMAVVCDMIAIAFHLPVNVVSAIIGGPVVIWVVIKQRTKVYASV